MVSKEREKIRQRAEQYVEDLYKVAINVRTGQTRADARREFWVDFIEQIITEARAAPLAADSEAKKPLTAKALLDSGLVGMWEGREDLGPDSEAAMELLVRNYDEETELDSEWAKQFTGDIAAALGAVRQAEREKADKEYNKVVERSNRMFQRLEGEIAERKNTEARAKALEAAARRVGDACYNDNYSNWALKELAALVGKVKNDKATR
jgi:hypothetical protein